MGALDDVMAALTRVGDQMQRIILAEGEIRAAQQRHPEAANRINRAFMLCAKGSVALRAPERAFLLHVRELLDRVAAREDTRPATDGELIAVFSMASQVCPLQLDAASAYVKLGRKHGLLEDDGVVLPESYPGAIDDTIARLRAQWAVPDRVLEDDE